ncbi:MAG: GNAT family N-acetyltransferase [Bacilli bacterium]|nr:GNAT family N-acetyltransferase [Bacilli bacterium]MBP3634898.1 GNAT family N-acetyltransferase [Bacilli bacterium]
MIVKENDISLLKNIFNEYKDNYHPYISEFTNIYTYAVENKIVGFLVFDIMYEKCEIIDIYVSENYRRKGIARLLLLEIEKDYSLENITLEVSSNNKSAIGLYEKLSYRKVAIRKNYYKDSDAILMLKEIR